MDSRLLPHGASGGGRVDELKGVKNGQLSFVTIANAVRTSGFLKLKEKTINYVTRKIEIDSILTSWMWPNAP